MSGKKKEAPREKAYGLGEEPWNLAGLIVAGGDMPLE
jgi:hypothetical protein